ncbi:MAG: hypothetical protein IPI60_17920 [Saprospiraceae bacterium]|nr:hypothetical protein [Saprospiraceae bacterium]
MNKHGPIIIIEDSLSDQFLLAEVFDELPYENELIFFCDGEQALEFLTKTEIAYSKIYWF